MAKTKLDDGNGEAIAFLVRELCKLPLAFQEIIINSPGGIEGWVKTVILDSADKLIAKIKHDLPDIDGGYMAALHDSENAAQLCREGYYKRERETS